MKHLASDDLTLDMVPDPDQAENHELWNFAHTFSAYTHWGGLEEAFAASNQAGLWQEAWLAEHGEPEDGFFPFPEPLLDYLRSDMFLNCRATRHCDQDGDDYSDSFWSGLREGARAVRHWLTQQPA